jgi:endonuclease YncB( thermonuclease family)
MNLRTCLLLAILLCSVSAVETAPVLVTSVHDGDTMTVQSSLGGTPFPAKIRLIFIDTPEVTNNDHGDAAPEGKLAGDALRELVNKQYVVLWGPGEKLEVDGYGRALALVTPVTVSTNTDGTVTRVAKDAYEPSCQEILISKGPTVYWRKYGEAPEPTNARLLKAQEDAKAASVGVWATNPKWMTDKANERTAPKKSR